MKKLMTKEEAYNLLIGSKIKVNRMKSISVQEVLFKAGIIWDSDKCNVRYTEDPYLYVDFGGVIRSDDDSDLFRKCTYKALTAKEVLEIEIEIETGFVPGEQVLVRDYDDEEWLLANYSFYDEIEKLHFTIGGLDWKKCIHYKGNERLLETCIGK